MSNFYRRFHDAALALLGSLKIGAALTALLTISSLTPAHAFITENQTDTTTPILPPDNLPFTISIQQHAYNLPVGLHSGASASYKGEWLFIAGRTNGLHGFGNGQNFPPSQQNTVAYVIDLEKQISYSRDLNDPTSGLSQTQIDELSVTSPQSFQNGKTLYICGGYGVDTATGQLSTKQTLTAIDLPKFIKWVKNSKGSAARAIRQTSSPWMQVTGGYMTLLNNHLQGLLIFGQNFTGDYTPSSNGKYTRQVRRFIIYDNGKKLIVRARKSEEPDHSYRRRDLNVVPIIKQGQPAFVALSGVFTEKGGIWTVPVMIDSDGSTSMTDPLKPDTFKQGMNNYVCASPQLYSKSSKDNYILLLGGISFGYYQNGVFQTDPEVPFINQVTTVKIDEECNFSQYLMKGEYPVIASQGTNPGNNLLFGAGAFYFNSDKVKVLVNQIVDFDSIKKPTVIGYIIGGIMSTLPNTNTMADSTASPYIFEVVVTPN